MLIKNQTRRNFPCIQFKFSLRIKNKMWILSLLFLMGSKLYHKIAPYHYVWWVGCRTAKPWPKLTMELEGVHYLFQIQREEAVWNKSPTHTCLCLNTSVSSQNQYKHTLVQTKGKESPPAALKHKEFDQIKGFFYIILIFNRSFFLFVQF